MWAFVIQIFWTIVVSLVISLFTKPKPQQNASPQNPDGAPSIADDAIIPVLFGTRVLSQNNVLWWGDTRTQAIKKGGGGGKK